MPDGLLELDLGFDFNRRLSQTFPFFALRLVPGCFLHPLRLNAGFQTGARDNVLTLFPCVGQNAIRFGPRRRNNSSRLRLRRDYAFDYIAHGNSSRLTGYRTKAGLQF
jgi:hypothetical protein